MKEKSLKENKFEVGFLGLLDVYYLRFCKLFPPILLEAGAAWPLLSYIPNLWPYSPIAAKLQLHFKNAPFRDQLVMVFLLLYSLIFPKLFHILNQLFSP